jgi:8-oxo-dGTP diphosphatase
MIHVAAALILNDAKNFLVAKRKGGELDGLWEFPGGKFENGETKNDTIVREIKEELNLDVTPRKNLGVFVHKYASEEIELELIECERDYMMQVPVSDGSHSEIKWANIDEAARLSFVPLDIKIIDFLKTYLK